MNTPEINLEVSENGGFLSKLPGMLRIAGAGALVLATLTFLVQGLDFESPLNRILNFAYLLFAVFGLGLVCKLLIQEIKGTKISMSLGLGMVPVIALQLGAVIYASVVAVTKVYPKYLAYGGFENNSQIILALSGIVIFAGLTIFAIKSISSFNEKPFSRYYLLGLLALMLPLRGNLYTLILAGVILLICTLQERAYFQKNLDYQTKEAAYLRFLLFVPALIILLRNVVLYAEGNLSLSLVFAGLAVIFGLVTSHIRADYYVRSKLVAIFCVLTSWVLLISELDQTILADYRYYVAYLPAILYCFNLQIRFPSGKVFLNYLANIGFVLMIVGQQSVNGGILDTSTALALCILGTGYAWTAKDKLTLFVSGFTLICLLTNYWDLVFRLYKLNPWMFMGVAGIATILLASYLEKHLEKVKGLLEIFKVKK